MNIYNNNNSHVLKYGHNITEKPDPAEFHLHDNFEIYFFLSGNVKYFIEKKVYQLRHGDLLLMNSNEIRKPSFGQGEAYERIVIHFEPAIAESLSSPTFDLLGCFLNRPLGEQNLISLNLKQIDEVIKIFNKIEAIEKNTGNGAEILRLSYFLELLVYINRVFANEPIVRGSEAKEEGRHGTPQKLVPVLDYIETNLEMDLTLKRLESKFFINRFHLSRLFKRITGSSLHEYIQIKRVSRAKKLLSEGCNVTEACIKSGFRDYSNFIRMFKRIVGVSPGSYRKCP